MKKIIPTILISIAVVALIMSFSRLESKPAGDDPQDMAKTGIPEEVTAILENSCYDCHTSEGSNLKARLKLNFSDWNDLSDAKKVGKLDDIAKEVSESKMPPSRYLDKNPSATLSKEQVETIVKWTDGESNKLMGDGK